MITDHLSKTDAFVTFRVAMYGALVTIVVTDDCVAASKSMNLKWCGKKQKLFQRKKTNSKKQKEGKRGRPPKY